jgi:hypothetical protein
MVTIFDMVTGELIHSDAPAAAERTAQAAETGHALIAPRLQTVEEASTAEARHSGMPADLLRMDIASFLDGQ